LEHEHETQGVSWLYVSASGTPPPRRYLYSDVVVELVWSNNPESCAGGSVAFGRASHDGQVKGDDPDKKGYLGLLDAKLPWGRLSF